MSRIRIKIAGESGAGLLSAGEIVTRALKNMGYFVVADREYPSLIKAVCGSCFRINASTEEIFSLDEEIDIMLTINRSSMYEYFDDLKKDSVWVHGYERLSGIDDLLKKAKKRGVKEVHSYAREIAFANGGGVLMLNMVLIGMLWKAMGFEYKYIAAEVKEQFKSKPLLLAIDLKCLKAGYDSAETQMQFAKPKKKTKTILLNGNKALALGGIHAGVRAYFAYPMSPSSSILTYFANYAKETGCVVKQAEDEITVANMTLGAMHMGTRALAATSGGGFDLMTETVSLAGIIETPLVLIVVQRPGPGTGLPTWTAQGDLNLSIFSSHGEFPKVVIGVSNPTDCFDLIQHALNIAEKYQCVVIVLSEKVIAESNCTVPPFKQNKIPIERGLVTGDALKKLKNSDRFKITKNGISKRWLPGTSKAYYFANGDEHWEDGSLTEDAKESEEMYAKRIRKIETISKALPEPEIIGPKKAKTSFVGWGNSKNVMLDIVQKHKDVNYLHFSYVWPLREKTLKKFFKNNKNVNLIEANATGQFGNLVEAAVHQKFNKRLLKYNGRPFFTEDVENFIKKNK